MKAVFLGHVFDIAPDNPNFGSNGGNYWFFRRIYALEDGRKFCVYRTTADLDYCEVSGSFENTRRWPLTIGGEKITVNGRDLYVQVSKRIFRTHKYITPRMLSEEEFAGLTIETDEAMTMEAKFIAYIVDRTPRNPSLSSNLDYWLFRDVYQLADGRRFVLYRTSAHYSFCGISGQFTETAEIPVTIDGEEVTIGEETLWVQADDWMEKAHKSAVPHILTDSEWNELKDIAITV